MSAVSPLVPPTVIMVPIQRSTETVHQPYGTASAIECREFLHTVLPTYRATMSDNDYVDLKLETLRRYRQWVTFETWLCKMLLAGPSAPDPMEPHR